MNHDMRKVLDLVAHFQIEAQKIMRYEKNPFVDGDSIAEHLARAARLLVYITPDLKQEFPDQPGLVEEIFSRLMVHDDDEINAGFDISTAVKVHNENDGEEIEQFTKAVSGLPAHIREFLIECFSSFRKRDTLAAKIAKALDNITGNQLVIEQGIGLINPDSARFCIEYAEKVRGISKTIDALVDAQIQQIIELRVEFLNNKTWLEGIKDSLGLSDIEKLEELLTIDMTTHVLDKSKVYVPIEKL